MPQLREVSIMRRRATPALISWLYHCLLLSGTAIRSENSRLHSPSVSHHERQHQKVLGGPRGGTRNVVVLRRIISAAGGASKIPWGRRSELAKSIPLRTSSLQLNSTRGISLSNLIIFSSSRESRLWSGHKWHTPRRRFLQAVKPRSWPSVLVGSSIESDFVGSITFNMNGAPSCAGVRPPEGMGPQAVIKGTPVSERDLAAAAAGGVRAVVWSARMGLGNTLRGFCSAFVFAFLSGRQLLRSHAGAHGHVMTVLCTAFRCGIDELQPHRFRAETINHGNPWLLDPDPVVQANSQYFFDSWLWHARTRDCVTDTLQCADVWCVRSRALQLLLLSPSPQLARAISQVIEVATPDEALAPRLGLRRLLLETARAVPGVPSVKLGWVRSPGIIELAPPDFVESSPGMGQEGKHEVVCGGRSPGVPGRADGEGQGQQQAGGWGGTAVRPGPGRGRRMQEVPQLGAVDHALRLQFDIAIQVRTLHRCVEDNQNGPGCRENGLAGAIAAANFSSELAKYVLAHHWTCLSGLLATLRKMKHEHSSRRGQQQLKDRDKLGPGGLPFLRDRRERAQLWESFKWLARQRGKNIYTPLPAAQTRMYPGMWSVPDAHSFARWSQPGVEQAGRGRGTEPQPPSSKVVEGAPLSIFLATDSHVLRPLFVEFLRPFGTVAYSRSEVLHLDRGHGDMVTRMGNIAEFFLLSRSSVVVSYTRRISTFALMAALYGNVSMVGGVGRRHCDFSVQHLAEAQSKHI